MTNTYGRRVDAMKGLQVVRFRSLEKPKEDEFCLGLSKLHNYDVVVERVARHLGLDDPSKIRFTSHNCYSGKPKPQPIKYRGVEHLSDMLASNNETSDILYYEVLDIPLPKLQGLKTLKVSFHRSTKNEVVIHTIRLPKQSTFGDVINDLKTKVKLSHPNAELRLFQVFYHKIYKIFPLDEKIENINDQYWTLRAEEIPEEEKNLGPRDRLIHVYHFITETIRNQVEVQNFGEPFFLVIREDETLAEIKVRIQKKLQVPDEEFSKWKFAFLSSGSPQYLQDSDIISIRFQRKNALYGVWEQYLGLEHSNNTCKRPILGNQVYQSVPKRSKATKQVAEHVPSKSMHSANAASKVRFLSSWVSSEASPILERIHCLYKGTFANFSMASRLMQTVVLESFASFMKSIATTKVTEVNGEADPLVVIPIEDFEGVGLDLSWLKQRIDEAKRVNRLETGLNAARAMVRDLEERIREHKERIRELEERRAVAKADVEIMSEALPKSLGLNDSVLKGVLENGENGSIF